MLLIEHLALPASVRRGVAADIVEECVAAENAAIIEQHHAGQAAVDAVLQPDVNGIKSIGDAAFSDHSAGGRDLIVNQRHH